MVESSVEAGCYLCSARLHPSFSVCHFFVQSLGRPILYLFSLFNHWIVFASNRIIITLSYYTTYIASHLYCLSSHVSLLDLYIDYLSLLHLESRLKAKAGHDV